jgi:hypothetical protein
MERVKGIEPSTSAWKAGVLPLNYTRISYRKDIKLVYARHAPASTSKLEEVYPSGQLVADSVEAKLVAGVLPLCSCIF